MSILLAPLVEETIFRGYIYPVLARSVGVGAGVVITGTLFGLLHAPQLWGGWGQILLLTGVGTIFTHASAISRTVVASLLVPCGATTRFGLSHSCRFTRSPCQFPTGPMIQFLSVGARHAVPDRPAGTCRDPSPAKVQTGWGLAFDFDVRSCAAEAAAEACLDVYASQQPLCAIKDFRFNGMTRRGIYYEFHRICAALCPSSW